ncbi:MAG: TonB-dependent receptor [Cyclobacteriaceae bacterium]
MRQVLLVILISSLGYTQAQTIKGVVKDNDGEALFSATVMLLQAEDSVLSSFAMSDASGAFEIKRVPKGDYLLRVNFVGLKPYDQKLQVAEQDIDLGTISLDLDALDEVVVEGEAIPITMKKDTIEYNAAAFETKPNAVVEDLLKKLPGVEVDRDGTVRSQGETVNKVLVDGKEFFGDDPQMATKNLPADAVNKVQVFDRKSEFSQFSGIDDGNESKTINLTLKEDHKKGTFGSLGGGYGTDSRNQFSADVNQFREDNQFSLIAKQNNINEQGFSISDYISFMGGLGNMNGGSGRISIGGNSGLPISNGLSDGFITTSAGGLNFNRDFNKKTEIRSSYTFSRIENNTDRFTDRTNFVNDEVFDTDENSSTKSIGTNHNLNINIKHEFDKSQDIQIRNSIGFQNGDVQNVTSTINASDLGSSTSLSDYSSIGSEFNMNSSVMYRKRFSKIGRTFITEFSFSNQLNDSDYLLNTLINPGAVATNQEQLSDNRSRTFGAEISYTEPIGRSKYLEFRYQRNITTGENDKDFYDLTSGLRVFNSTLSSLFERRFEYNRTGVSFNFAKEDFRITAGSNYQFSTLDGEELNLNNAEISKDFNKTLPFARINYDFSPSAGVSLNYSTRLNVPTISQLQPVADNSNPLNVYEGNPALDAEYIHSARLNFRFFDQFSSTSLFSFIDVSYTLDNIVTSRTVDNTNFSQISRPVNADNSVTVSHYTSFSRPIKFAKTRFRISNRIAMNEGFTIINDITSETTNTNNTLSISFENLKKKIVDWNIGTDYTTGKTDGSQEVSSQDFTNQTYFLDVTISFLNKWSMSSNFDYRIFESASFTDDQEIQLWEASIQRNVMKNDRGEFKISVFDILSQNQGINRTTNFNFIEEERISSIGTYYMFSFTYRLSAFEQNRLSIRQGRRGR